MKHSVLGRGSPLALLAALAGFALSIPASAQSTLSSLMYFNGSRGLGTVALGTDGNLYGIGSESQVGSGATAGLIYKLSTTGTSIETLYQYGRLGNYTGGGPRGTLARDASGNFYGVTAYSAIDSASGLPIGNGTVFKITQNGTYTRLYAFSNFTTTADPFLNLDGAAPSGSLIVGSDGFLYGTTVAGGTFGGGTVFKIKTDGTGFLSIYSFGAPSGTTNPDTRAINADGLQPQARLLLASNGDLYGTTTAGGANGTGVIYRLHRDGTGFTLIKTFDASPDIDTSTGAIKTNASGGYPAGGLIEPGNGYLYGTTTTLGSTGYGNIYRVLPDGTGYTELKALDLDSGIAPFGELLVANDGTLVGTTSAGAKLASGETAGGTLFSMYLDGTGFSTLYIFDGANGGAPGAGVVQGSDGAFYGTTTSGSPWGLGTVFKYGAKPTAPVVLGTPPPYDDGGAMGWMLIAALGSLVLARLLTSRFARSQVAKSRDGQR